MTGTFGYYSDDNLAVPDATIPATQNADGSSAPVQVKRNLGSTAANKKIRDSAAPGTNQIAIEVRVVTPSYSHVASEVKLALTQAGLASATPGAPLNIGTEVLSGIANRRAVWVEVDDATYTSGFFAVLKLHTVNDVQEDIIV